MNQYFSKVAIKNGFLTIGLILYILFPGYANDDLKAFRGMEGSEAYQFLFDLQKDRGAKLAELLLDESDAKTAYLGVQYFIEHKQEEKGFKALARIVAQGKDETELNGRMGYDWAHNDDINLPMRMMMGMYRHLNDNFSGYSKDEQARIMTHFNRMGLTGEYDKQKMNIIFDKIVNMHKKRHEDAVEYQKKMKFKTQNWENGKKKVAYDYYLGKDGKEVFNGGYFEYNKLGELILVVFYKDGSEMNRITDLEKLKGMQKNLE